MLIILVSLISVVTGEGILSTNETNADYKYLFDGCCRGKAKAFKAAGDMSHAECASECKKDSKCIAMETAGWNKKSGQYGSCYLFKDSGEKEITNGGCNTSGHLKCFEKIDEKECSCKDVAEYEYLFDGCCRGKAKAFKAAGDMSHEKCESECKKDSKCIAIETAGWNKKSGQYGSCYLFKDSGKKEIANGGCNTSGHLKCFEKKECSCKDVAEYEYLFDGCCRGKAKAFKAAGDMSHAKCESECKKDSTCIAFETSGWNKKSGQYGSCYLFKDSGKKEITNGGCNTSGDKKCFGKIDEKEEEASSGGNSTTATSDPPTTSLCTASCAKEFQKCHNHHNKRKGKTCTEAFDQCRGEINTGFHRLANAGCMKQCTSTDDMLKLKTCDGSNRDGDVGNGNNP